MKDNNYVINVKFQQGSNAILEFKTDKININEEVFIGKNGITADKKEGDGKTPIGNFELGRIFGIAKKDSLKLNTGMKYEEVNENLYWVDDVNSKYYNQMVDITNVKKDWKSAEHLIDYREQYKYAVEIKTNPENIPGKGSAIFLHCSVGKPTKGCIAISCENMKRILENITESTIVSIS